MDDESALVAPPPTLLLPLGEPMVAVAEVMRSRIASVEVAETTDGQSDLRVLEATTLAVVLLISPQTDLTEVQDALSWLTGQRLPRRTRIWIAADSHCPRSLLAGVDAYLDSPTAPQVDSVVIVPPARPAAMGVALQAWLWLRHDAPSSAFADLRDAGGACRFAAVTAVAPASPPPDDPTRTSTTRTTGEHALMVLQAELDRREAAASTIALDRARHVVAASGGAGPLTAADLAPPIPEVDRDDIITIVDALGRHDVTGLQAAERACRESLARAAHTPSPDAASSEAALALVQADTAIRLEQERTGFASKIGRRKRLAAATAARTLAGSQWAELHAERAAALTRLALMRELEGALAAAVDDEQRAREQQLAEAARKAQVSWLDDARAAALSANPAIRLDPRGLSRAWGRAAPAVRRYVLMPPGFGEIHHGHDFDDVQVRIADGLGTPIAAAILMGLPLAGMTLTTEAPEPTSAPAE